MSTANDEQDWKENPEGQTSWEGFATHLAAVVFRWRSLQRASFHSRMASEIWMSSDERAKAERKPKARGVVRSALRLPHRATAR